MRYETSRFDTRPFDPRAFAPGFHSGSRIRAHWTAGAGEKAGLYWRADIAPRTLNWVQALKASATALAHATVIPARS
jgi:hypothetical protein